MIRRKFGLAMNESGDLFISDCMKHEVKKLKRDEKTGVIVAGGNGQGKLNNQLSHPQGLIVNKMDDIYIVDSDNHRIMCWKSGSKEDECILDAFDSNNHRIQKFQIQNS